VPLRITISCAIMFALKLLKLVRERLASIGVVQKISGTFIVVARHLSKCRLFRTDSVLDRYAGR
jgi:hypothetical protein